MTPEIFRNPISLFDSITDADLTRFGVQLGCEFEMVLDGRHSERDSYDEDDYRQHCADNFSSSLSTTVGQVTDDYGSHRSEGYTSWHFTGDGSISTDHEGDIALELVSPIIPYADMFPTWRRLRDWTQNRRAYANRSCGMHTGVSANQNASVREFDPILFAMLVDDAGVLSQCGRQSNGYANPIIPAFFGRCSAERIRDLLARNPRDLRRAMADLAAGEYMHDSRYSVNYSHLDHDRSGGRYVEYRSPGGNWIDLPELFIQSLFRRIGVAYLAASGQISHPELNSAYKLRLSYASRNSSRNHAGDFFPSDLVDMPSAFTDLTQNGFWLNAGVDGAYQYIVTISQRGDLNLMRSPLATAGYSSPFGFGIPTSRFTNMAGFNPSNDSLRPNWDRTTSRGTGIERLNASRRLLRFFTAEVTNGLLIHVVRSLREGVPDHTATQYREEANKVLSLIEQTKQRFLHADTRRNVIQILRAIWTRSASDRVRRQAISRSVAAIQERIASLPVTQRTRQAVQMILDHAISSGSPLFRNNLQSLLSPLSLGRRDVAAQELLLAEVFLGSSVTNQLRDHLRHDSLQFASVDHTAAVFTQPTDARPYHELYSMLTPHIIAGETTTLPAPNDLTARTRAALVDCASRIPRNIRVSWAATGARTRLDERLRGRVIRPILLGESA